MTQASQPEPSLRRDQAQAVRERILTAAIAVIEDGDEPTMRSIAVAAQISERTVYRYFAAREDLHAALTPILRERASAQVPTDADGLETYVRALYTTFDDNARLARALVQGSWVPRQVMRPENLRKLQKVIDRAFPGAPRADRKSAAAGLRVPLSAAGWAYLSDCGLGAEARITHVQWLTRTLLERLGALQGDDHA